jgi:hypothetical protein
MSTITWSQPAAAKKAMSTASCPGPSTLWAQTPHAMVTFRSLECHTPRGRCQIAAKPLTRGGTGSAIWLSSRVHKWEEIEQTWAQFLTDPCPLRTRRSGAGCLCRFGPNSIQNYQLSTLGWGATPPEGTKSDHSPSPPKGGSAICQHARAPQKRGEPSDI